MAIAFNDTKGEAQKGAGTYKYVDGNNVIRLLPGIIPRYTYWVGKTPIECLSFNRETEKFDNIETDYVQIRNPKARCGWAYTMRCLDPLDGKVKGIHLKKKLFLQILEAADELGDPTDLETGYPIIFRRQSTGSEVYNVEYTLQVLKLSKVPVPLTEAEKLSVAAAPSLDSMFPRPTSDEIKAKLDAMDGATAVAAVDNATKEAIDELAS